MSSPARSKHQLSLSTILVAVTLSILVAATSSVAVSKITAGQIANNAVRARHVKRSNITTAKLAAAAVTSAKLANSAVTSAKLADNIVVEGAGQMLSISENLADSTAAHTVFEIPNLGNYRTSCSGGVGTFSFANNSGSTIYIQTIFTYENGATDVTTIDRNAVGDGGTLTAPNLGTLGMEGIQFMITGAAAGSPVTSIWASTVEGNALGCHVMSQALIGA